MTQEYALSGQPFAVGRLVLNLPSPKRVNFGKTRISDIEPEWVDLKPEQSLAEWLEERKMKAVSGEISNGRKDSVVRSYITPDGVPFLIYWEYPNSNLQRIEGYRNDGRSILIAGTDVFPNEIQGAEGDLRAMLHSFQSQPKGSDIHEGYAIDRGVLQRSFDTNEKTNVTMIPNLDGLGSDAEVDFSISMGVYAKATPSTIPGRAKREMLMTPMLKAETPGLSMRTLRLGSRTVAGLTGEEWISRMEDKNNPDQYGLSCEFEFGGDANNPQRPYLDINFGALHIPRSYPQEKLTLLWEDALRSARFHP